MNVIFIVADDLGWGDVGYHSDDAITPNIDDLSSKGIRLENFYVQACCSPTRCAFMTGKYPYKVGIQRVLWPWNQHGIDPNIDLLPTYFKKANYDTAIFGKWNLGHAQDFYLPTSRGFDYHYGTYNGSLNHYDHTYYGVHDLNENKKPVYDEGHVADLLTNKVLEKIENRDKNKEFFYYIPFNSPHAPILSPPYFDMFFQKLKDRKRASYLAMIYHFDFCIGRIVAALKKQKILEDTLIWFSSDNGGWLDYGGSNGELSGGKANGSNLGLSEGALKGINFVYYEPWNNGTINSNLFHAIDIFPTLTSLIDVPVESSIDGVNIAPYLNEPLKERFLIQHLVANEDGSMFGSCRNNDMKLIVSGEKTEFYNIKKDPFEKENLVGQFSEIEESLRSHMKESLVDYKPDPIMWYRPNGYPENFVFPKEWNSVVGKNNCIKMLSSEDRHVFDFENHSAAELLGYYNLIK